MRINYLIYTLITLAVIYMWIMSRGAPNEAQAACRIGYVYDGDTVELICGDVSQAARITGFDTPETRDAACEAELEHGQKATERLRALLKGAPVTYRQVGVDRYQRPLIKLWVDGVSVGEVLVREGLAVPYYGGQRISWCARL